jgi:glycerol uptake facilitator-like aquaporin
MTTLRLDQRVVLEFVGTALLLAAVVGSGIMAQRLAGGDVALALLCNTLATAGALVALLTSLGPLCGAHLNPIVTAAEALTGMRPWSEVLPYALAQVLGGLAGVGVANAMFGEPLFFASRHARSGPAQILGEAVATFGLVFVIFVCSKARPAAVPYAVATYITAAYWFTSSTSFANPAVTIARSLSDTFAGIRPADVPGFVAAQLAGAAVALAVVRYAVIAKSEAIPDATRNVVRHPALTVRERSNQQRRDAHRTL